jgi:hypothetical protein
VKETIVPVEEEKKLAEVRQEAGIRGQSTNAAYMTTTV